MIDLAVYSALVAILSQEALLITKHPSTANPRSDSVDALCGGYRLQISGYGSRSIPAEIATIVADGSPVAGDDVDTLRADLSQRGAVYRFGVICSNTREITIRIDRGQRLRDGSVEYRVGLAVLNGTTLTSYSGLDEADHETFWF